MGQPSVRLDLDSGPHGILRLEFCRQGDRYAHFVRLVTHDHSLALLQSCDGPDDATWPQSPPLQELEVDRDGPHATLMLLGRTTTGHWSLCVSRERGRFAFLFDVACRARCQPSRLGSRYLAEWNPFRGAEPPKQTRQSLGAVPCGPAGELAAAGPDVADAFIRRTASHIDVNPALPSGPFPRTVRWRYRIELLPDPPVPS